MKELDRHHHFRTPLIEDRDYAARLEAIVVEMLVTTAISDDERDSSIAWELKHQAGVTQMARLLAAKRNLDTTVAAIGALLHDIYVIETGSYSNHARQGGPIAERMLAEVGYGDTDGKRGILSMVTEHSDKDFYSDDPYAELGKDVDVLDCLLYPGAIAEYLLTKPFGKVKQYLARAQGIWKELKLPIPPSFTILDEYADGSWMVNAYRLSDEELVALKIDIENGAQRHPILLTENDGNRLVYSTRNGSAYMETRGYQESEARYPMEHGTILWPDLDRRQRIDDPTALQLMIGSAR